MREGLVCDEEVLKRIWRGILKIEKENAHTEQDSRKIVKDIMDVVDEELDKCC